MTKTVLVTGGNRGIGFEVVKARERGKKYVHKSRDHYENVNV
jgi:NAD(P)-dependent dehydrogenase (short-subunit alcohol dehydrogenase family)